MEKILICTGMFVPVIILSGALSYISFRCHHPHSELYKIRMKTMELLYDQSADVIYGADISTYYHSKKCIDGGKGFASGVIMLYDLMIVNIFIHLNIWYFVAFVIVWIVPIEILLFRIYLRYDKIAANRVKEALSRLVRIAYIHSDDKMERGVIYWTLFANISTLIMYVIANILRILFQKA